MATDYRFAIGCWQDQAGDENAKLNVFINDIQVLTEEEITATSEDAYQLVTWESTGLPDVASDSTVTIRVELANEYYVDSSTDRNIRINKIGYIDKCDDSYRTGYMTNTRTSVDDAPNIVTVTDFTTESSYVWLTPTTVTAPFEPDGWWDNTVFNTIVLWGGESTGVTITHPLTSEAIHKVISS